MPGLDRVREVLEEARDLGFLGPGPVDPHIGHSLGFVEAWTGRSVRPPSRVADLGSGGGVPGLVLAAVWPDSTLYLIESMGRRAAFLSRAVETLELNLVDVIQSRAEDVGRDPAFRETFDLVTSRGFGPPAVTAECAAPLLQVGGYLIVSEPPEPDAGRWPEVGLSQLGLGFDGWVRSEATFAVLGLHSNCPARFPRRAGIPSKRPLFPA